MTQIVVRAIILLVLVRFLLTLSGKLLLTLIVHPPPPSDCRRVGHPDRLLFSSSSSSLVTVNVLLFRFRIGVITFVILVESLHDSQGSVGELRTACRHS